MVDVSFTDGNVDSAVTSLANAITTFNNHTVEQNGTTLTITYKDHQVSNSSVNTSEGVFSADGTSPAGDNISLSVVQNGTAAAGPLEQTPSNTLDNFSDTTQSDPDSDDSTDIEIDYRGRRYGLDPQHAQSNGTFYIDNLRGHIHFGSSLAGETIILKYVSDGAGTDEEMVIHKFCEEACYKWIMYGVLSGRSNIPEYLVQRFKKEKFAETRKAKIRLSNIKMEEFTQVLKGMGKQIK